MWSAAKRHMRKLYGQRILTHTNCKTYVKNGWLEPTILKLFKDMLTYLRFRVVLF